MGFLDWLGLRDAVAIGSPSASRGVASPWAGPSTLHRIVLDDILGQDTSTVSRAQAMSVPAVAKARHLICTTLARQPLKAYKDGVPFDEQPNWLTRTDTGEPPRLRMLWTIDDLLFSGWSLWATNRGSEGQILDARRVPVDRWTFDTEWRVKVDETYPDADEVLLIPGIGEGLLIEAARTIRGAINLETQWSARVKNPVPIVELRYTGTEDLTKTEMEDIRDTYVTARSDENGVIMVTPGGFEMHAHGDQALELFVEGRNAASLDVARYANMPATAADASAVNASSVTYQNVMAGRTELHDYTLRGWALPVEERFSMDDCVPRGQYVAFDLSALTVTPDPGTGPTLED